MINFCTHLFVCEKILLYSSPEVTASFWIFIYHMTHHLSTQFTNINWPQRKLFLWATSYNVKLFKYYYYILHAELFPGSPSLSESKVSTFSMHTIVSQTLKLTGYRLAVKTKTVLNRVITILALAFLITKVKKNITFLSLVNLNANFQWYLFIESLSEASPYHKFLLFWIFNKGVLGKGRIFLLQVNYYICQNSNEKMN